MKSYNTSWIGALVSIIIGIVLIIYHGQSDILSKVVVAMGIVIAVTGGGMTLFQILVNKDNRNIWLALLGFAILVCGLWLCFDSHYFANFVIYVFAAALLLSGIWHIFTVKFFSKDYKLPFWLFLIPALMIVMGVIYIFDVLRISMSAATLLVGILLVLSSVNILLIMVMRKRDQPGQLTSDKKKRIAE